MLEYDVIIGLDKVEEFMFIYDNLKSRLQSDGILVSQYIDEFNHVLIAAEETHKNFVTISLKRCLSFCIVNFFKKDFIERRLSKAPKGLKCDIFIKAISYFDDDCDLRLAFEKLEISPQILLTSLYEFSTLTLKTKWKSLCDLALENPVELISEENFENLCKFLIENIPSVQDKIEIDFEENKTNIIFKNEIRIVENEEIITSIVANMPSLINVNINKENLNEIEKLFLNIFENKISLNYSKELLTNEIEKYNIKM